MVDDSTAQKSDFARSPKHSERCGPEIHREKGNFNQAIELYQQGERVSHVPSAGLAVTYARMGRMADAQRKVDELIQRSRETYQSADKIATVYVAIGQTETAFAWLERAYREHSSSLTGIATRSEFRPLWQDPRFIDLVKRVGLDPAKTISRTGQDLGNLPPQGPN